MDGEVATTVAEALPAFSVAFLAGRLAAADLAALVYVLDAMSTVGVVSEAAVIGILNSL